MTNTDPLSALLEEMKYSVESAKNHVLPPPMADYVKKIDKLLYIIRRQQTTIESLYWCKEEHIKEVYDKYLQDISTICSP